MNGPYGTFEFNRPIVPLSRKMRLEIKAKMPKLGVDFKRTLLGDRASRIVH